MDTVTFCKKWHLGRIVFAYCIFACYNIKTVHADNWYHMSIILLKGIFVGPTLYYHNPQLVDSRITCSQE